MELEGFVSLVWVEYITKTWPQLVFGKCFFAWCDNDPWVVAVNKGKHLKSPVIVWLLRRLHILESKFNFRLRLEYVSSKANVIADALSRNDWGRVRAELARVSFPTSSLSQVSVEQLGSLRDSSHLSTVAHSNPDFGVAPK